MRITIFSMIILLATAHLLGGEKNVVWDPYTDTVDGLNLYRAPSAENGGVVLVWTLVNTTALIPAGDISYLDTPVAPGWYCWQLKAVIGATESPGSNITCSEVVLDEVQGVR